jgi:hypothetical protein
METKSQAVRNVLATQPNLSAKEIANVAECDVTLVYQIKRENGMNTKAKVMKAIKVTKAKKANKVGRPNIFESLEKACETLLKFVGSRKDMCIAFDTAKDKVEIVWGEEIYNVATNEVIDILMAIKKLESHKQVFSFNNEAN